MKRRDEPAFGVGPNPIARLALIAALSLPLRCLVTRGGPVILLVAGKAEAEAARALDKVAPLPLLAGDDVATPEGRTPGEVIPVLHVGLDEEADVAFVVALGHEQLDELVGHREAALGSRAVDAQDETLLDLEREVLRPARAAEAMPTEQGHVLSSPSLLAADETLCRALEVQAVTLLLCARLRVRVLVPGGAHESRLSHHAFRRIKVGLQQFLLPPLVVPNQIRRVRGGDPQELGHLRHHSLLLANHLVRGEGREQDPPLLPPALCSLLAAAQKVKREFLSLSLSLSVRRISFY